MKKAAVFIILLLLTLSACAEQPAPAEPSPTPPPPVTDAEIRKYDAYAGLVNVLAADLAHIADAYTAEFGSAATVYIVNGFTGCELPDNAILPALDDATPYAETEPRLGGADDALSALEPVLRAYLEAYGDAVGYYGGSGYAYDSFARSQPYHDAITGAWNDVSAKTEAFLRAFYALSDEFDARLLRYYNEAGYPLHYAALNALMCAERVTDYLDDNGAISSESEIDATAFAQICAAFTSACEAWRALDDNPDIAREGLRGASAWNAALDDTQSAIDAFAAATETGEHATVASLRACVNALVAAYNDMV